MKRCGQVSYDALDGFGFFGGGAVLLLSGEIAPPHGTNPTSPSSL